MRHKNPTGQLNSSWLRTDWPIHKSVGSSFESCVVLLTIIISFPFYQDTLVNEKTFLTSTWRILTGNRGSPGTWLGILGRKSGGGLVLRVVFFCVWRIHFDNQTSCFGGNQFRNKRHHCRSFSYAKEDHVISADLRKACISSLCFHVKSPPFQLVLHTTICLIVKTNDIWQYQC